MKKQQTIIEKRFLGVKASVEIDNKYVLKDGTSKVVMKIYHNGKYSIFSTGHHAGSVDDIDTCVINSLQKTVDAFFIKHQTEIEGGNFSLKSINRKDDSKAPVETLLGLIDRRIEQMKAEHRYGTLSHWNGFRKAVADSISDIPLKNLCSNSMKPFSDYLTKYAVTTRTIYLNDLRSTINEGIYNKLIKPEQSPFRVSRYDTDKTKILIPRGIKRVERYLTIEEMKRIWDYNIQNPDKHISLFLLSYLWGGINMADLLGLKFDQHWKNTDCSEVAFIRKKTENKSDSIIRLPITDKVKTLFGILGIEEKEGRMFPVPVEPHAYYKTVNMENSSIASKFLKVCKKTHIDKKITATYARHSFATIASRLMLPFEWIEYEMGHINRNIASHYLGGFSSEQLHEFCGKML